MKKAVIVGAGGHAKVVIDIIKSSRKYKLAGCVDANQKLREFMGLPVLGDDSMLPKILEEGIDCILVAIGANKRRDMIFSKVIEMGFEPIDAISPFTCVSKSVKLGKGIVVMPGAVINVDSIIGDNVIINTGATVDHDCIIKRSSHIAPGCNIAGNVTIGVGTFLGVGCRVIPRVKVGDWCIVGAGSVVINDIPDGSKVYGVPVKMLNNREKEGIKE